MNLSKGAQLVCTRLNRAGFSAYAVGGCVRDWLMSKKPSDFDITTDALPHNTKALFNDFTTYDSGITHGTVAVVIDGEPIEITTFRQDGEYVDHRHPAQVLFSSSLDADLSRRDFTVNAMAYSSKTGIIDLFGGKEDIQNRIIKCVGEPEKRFEEDALRILRALRFSSVLDFTIEDKTAKAIHSKASLLDFVSRERIAIEMKKLLCGTRVARIVKEYKDVFDILFGTVYVDPIALTACEGYVARAAVFFFNKPEAFYTLKPSRYEKNLIKTAISLAHEPSLNEELEVKRLIAQYGLESVRLSYEIRCAMGYEPADALERFDSIVSSSTCLKREDLALTGKDIIAFGVEPSKRVGEILDALFESVITGETSNSKQELMQKMKDILGS